MGQLDHQLLDLRGLDERQFFRHKARSYLECSTDKLHERFALELHRQMEEYIAKSVALEGAVLVPAFGDVEKTEAGDHDIDGNPREKLGRHSVFGRLAAGDPNVGLACFVPNLGYTGSLDDLKDKSKTIRARDGGVAAVSFLEAWATSRDEPSFCAVLGECGVGKTTTLMQLTRRLLDSRQAGKQAPLPIFIDLRSYVQADTSTTERLPKLREILAVILDRQPWLEHETTLTPDDILTLVREEGALIIFDGLDEKIVHLTPRQSQAFIRELWGSLPSKKQFPRCGKMILSCRSHYFPDVRSQEALLTGEDREDKTVDDYRACLILPFTEMQIREYLKGVLGADRVEPAMELFAAVHNLRELAERPYLLSIIVRQIDGLERRRAAGQTVWATDLYEELAQSWLHRDDGKHVFSREEKQRLMEELAAALFKSGEREWPWERLTKWLVQFLTSDTTTAFRHRNDDHELLEQDLRTASFILRPDTGGAERLDHFRFAHTSLQEYFLACHLARALRENRSERWDLPRVSTETLDFLGQLLATSVADAASIGVTTSSSRTQPQYARDNGAIGTLNQILAGDCLPAAVLAFHYWLHAMKSGYPEPSPAHVNLAGADLEEVRIEGSSTDRPLRLRGANLAGAKLNRARLRYVDLTSANLANLEARQGFFQAVVAAGAIATGADLSGLKWRGGSLARANLCDGRVAGVQSLHVDLTDAKLPPSWQQYASSVADFHLESRGTTPATSFDMPAIATVTGHSDRVMSCDFRQDGQRLVTGSGDHTVKLWDVQSGACLLTLEGHQSAVTCCTFSVDGRRVLSSSDDRSLKVWDSQNGACLLTVEGQVNSVTNCALSADGRRMLAGSSRKTLRVWDAQSGAELLTLEGHFSSVTTCAFSPDGRRLLSGSKDGNLKIWDSDSGECLLTFTGHKHWVTSCGFSSDGQRLVSGSSDKTLKVWDAQSGACVLTLEGHANGVTDCAFSPDGRRLVSGSKDNTLKVWDAMTGECHMTIEGDANWVTCCAFSPDGRLILSGSNDNSFKISSANSGQCLLVLDGNANWVNCCASSPDARRFLSGSGDKTIKLWDAQSGACTLTLEGHPHSFTACAFSPDSQRFVSGSSDKSLRLWDVKTGGCLLTLSGHARRVSVCAFSIDGLRLASGDDRTVRIWDSQTGACLQTLRGHAGRVNACAFSPDGRLLLSGSRDTALKVWNYHTGECVLTLKGQSSSVLSCAVSPDSRLLVSGYRNKMLMLWDAEDGACLLALKAHSDRVNTCAFSPDGRLLVSGSGDTTLKVWDVKTSACVLVLTGHGNSVTSCAFSPDGLRILSGSGDNTLKIWDAETGRCLWTGLLFPDREWAAVDFEGNRVLAASPGAWRFLGWRVTDPHTGDLRILPAEYYGPLPATGE